MDTPILEPVDGESLPPRSVFRMYFGSLDHNRQDTRPVEFAVVREGVEVEFSELASVKLDPDYMAYYELQKPEGESHRFHLVLKAVF